MANRMMKNFRVTNPQGICLGQINLAEEKHMDGTFHYSAGIEGTGADADYNEDHYLESDLENMVDWDKFFEVAPKSDKFVIKTDNKNYSFEYHFERIGLESVSQAYDSLYDMREDNYE